MWYLYICQKSKILYTGITTDLDNRMRQHNAELLYSEEFQDKHEAAKREKQIKGWSKLKKFTLITTNKA